MTNYYSIEYNNLWMAIKESALRTNAAGKDTTNGAGYSYRRFPIRWEHAIEPRRLIHRIVKRRSAGKGLDYSHVYREGYEPCKFTIKGDIVDFAFMYQAFGACLTAGSYTHTWNNSNLTDYIIGQPSFQMLQKVANVTTAQDEYLLYIGCKIMEFSMSWKEGESLQGSLTIECANVIAGTAPTTEPSWIADNPYYFSPLTGFTLSKDAGAYVGFLSSFEFKFNNGQYLRKIQYMDLADKILEDFRTIELNFNWIPETKTNIQLDPETEDDIDISHTVTNGVDTFVMTWSKITLEFLGEAYDYKKFYLGRKYKATLNPNQTSVLSMVETNSDNNTFYEGA